MDFLVVHNLLDTPGNAGDLTYFVATSRDTVASNTGIFSI